MRGNGSGRTALRFPPLPGPVDEYEYRDPWVLDITTTGPLTVVYYVGIVRQGFSTLDDSSGLYAVEVSDPGSSLFSGPPLRLVLPEAVSFGNVSRWGAFSLSPERLALVAPLGEPGHVFMTAAVDRDLNDGSITGLADSRRSSQGGHGAARFPPRNESTPRSWAAQPIRNPVAIEVKTCCLIPSAAEVPNAGVSNPAWRTDAGGSRDGDCRPSVRL